MDDYGSLSHTKWECKYHVVFIPKCRRKTLYGELRKHLGEVFRGLAEQKESRIEEGHLMVDHVHMMISSTRFIKGKSAIHLARVYGERKRNFVGQHFGHEGARRVPRAFRAVRARRRRSGCACPVEQRQWTQRDHDVSSRLRRGTSCGSRRRPRSYAGLNGGTSVAMDRLASAALVPRPPSARQGSANEMRLA